MQKISKQLLFLKGKRESPNVKFYTKRGRAFTKAPFGSMKYNWMKRNRMKYNIVPLFGFQK
jgi:hypothetical protein